MRWPGFVVIAVVGCGGGGGAPDATVGDSAPLEPPEVEMRGLIQNLISRDAIEGVTVEILDHPELGTATTGANGRWSIENVPANQTYVVHFEIEGYMPAVSRYVAVAEADFAVASDTALFMVSDGVVTTLANFVGVTIDPEKGIIALNVYGGPTAGQLPGATAAISPASGAGPYYFGPDGLPDPALTETSSNSSVTVVNVDPGDIDVTVAHPDVTTCWGFADDEPWPVAAPVFAGTMTLVGTIACQ